MTSTLATAEGRTPWDWLYDWLVMAWSPRPLSADGVAEGIAELLRRCGVTGVAVEVGRCRDTREWFVRIEWPDRRVAVAKNANARLAINEAVRLAVAATPAASPTVGQQGEGIA